VTVSGVCVRDGGRTLLGDAVEGRFRP
jgi:hypothetical protein